MKVTSRTPSSSSIRSIWTTMAIILMISSFLLATTTTLLVNADQDNNVGLSTEEDLFECRGICGNNPEGTNQLNNPDTTVTYNWASRVPVPNSQIGETEQTMTCQQFDSRLYAFSADPSDCTSHQTGIQAAGCVCGDGSGAMGSLLGGSFGLVVAIGIVTSSLMGTLLTL